MRRPLALRLLWLLGVCSCVLSTRAAAQTTVTHPYLGVIHISRTDSTPRPVVMHIVEIDLTTPSIRFLVTPHSGGLDTYKQTTLQFLMDENAQIAINAHFFEPWPPPSPDPGTADLVGLAASDGNVYSPFEAHPAKTAIQPNAPALNLDPGNHASIVHRDFSDATGFSVIEPVVLCNTVAGNEQIITDGVNTTPNDSWNRATPRARTAIGVSGDDRTLYLFTVDNAGASQGMTPFEVAELLRAPPYDVYNALNLDGGGSCTLAMEDPVSGSDSIVNVPEGAPRSVGSSLAIFAVSVTGVAQGDPRPGLAWMDLSRPNPFRRATSLSFNLPRAEHAEVRVVDVAGRLVRTLARGISEAGWHHVEWDGRDSQGVEAASGCYVIQFSHEEGVLSRKVVLIR
jgi:phosphodiester glycosidase/flagellar hook capping protein FlgD